MRDEAERGEKTSPEVTSKGIRDLSLIREEVRTYIQLFKEKDLRLLKVKIGESFQLLLKKPKEISIKQYVVGDVVPFPVDKVQPYLKDRKLSVELREERRKEITKGEEQPTPPQVKSENLYELKAPLSGTFYRAPYPGADPFVNVGDRVVPGQVLCIIEAMKVMNEITSPVSGVVKEILPANGEPVKEGDVIFRIEVS